MLMNAEPRLRTICEPVSLIAATVAPTSMASSWRVCRRPDGSRWLPSSPMLSTIASHFDWVREAMQMSPSSSLCMAALWAATWATPPAPMISTLRLVMSRSLGRIAEAGSEVVIGELAHHLDATVEAADGDRGRRRPLNHEVLTIV